MTIGDRIRELLDQHGMSQAELARRVGLRQSAINQLVLGKSMRSRHLPEIARELGTTAEYLAGEGDDLDPGDISGRLSSEEREVLEILRDLDTRARAGVIEIARLLADRKPDDKPTLHAPVREYRAA